MKTAVKEEDFVGFVATIGTKLREIRESRAKSQEQLADDMGISVITVRKIEAGKFPFDMKVLFLLKEKLGFDIVFEMY